MTTVDAGLPPRQAPTVDGGRQHLVDPVRAEWLKLRSGRATRLALVVAVLVPILLSLWECQQEVSQWAQLTPAERLDFDPVSTSLNGLLFSQVVVGIVAALLFTSEYSTGTIKTTFTAVPRRTRVLVSKTVVMMVVTFVVVGVTAVAAFALGQAVMGGSGPPASVGFGDPAVLHALLGTATYGALLAGLCVSLGALIRYTAGATIAIVTITVILMILVLLVPFRQTLAAYVPGNILYDQISHHPQHGPWQGIVVMTAYFVVAFALAAWRLNARDA